MKNLDLVDRLDPEKKQEVKSIKVENSKFTKGLDNILLSWEKIISSTDWRYNLYSFCLGAVPKDYSVEDVQFFSLRLIDYESCCYFSFLAGYYLSALINLVSSPVLG